MSSRLRGFVAVLALVGLSLGAGYSADALASPEVARAATGDCEGDFCSPWHECEHYGSDTNCDEGALEGECDYSFCENDPIQ